MPFFAWNGLCVASDRDLPRLAPLTAVNTDVTFQDAGAGHAGLLADDVARPGSPPGPLARRLADGTWGIVYGGVCAFHLDIVKRQIACVSAPGADWAYIEHLLVNHVLGVYASLCGHLCLHAVALGDAAGDAELICGPSGAGKSTAAAQRVLEGRVLLADDMVLLWPHDRGFAVRLGPRRLRLRQDAPCLAEVQRRWSSSWNGRKHEAQVPHADPRALFRVAKISVPGPRPDADWRWSAASADPGRAVAVLCGQVPAWFPLTHLERASRFGQVVDLTKGVF